MTQSTLPLDGTPRLIRDLPFEDYVALEGTNQTVLKLLDESRGTPKHAKAASEGRLKLSSNVLSLGRAEHCWIVEGETEFNRRYIVAPPCERILKSGKRKGQPCGKSARIQANGAWLCKQHYGKDLPEESNIISARHARRIREMGESLKSHEINAHLKRPGWAEVTITYSVEVAVTVRCCPQCGLRDIDSRPRFRKRGYEYTCPACKATFDIPGQHSETVTLPHKLRIDRLAEPAKDQPYLVLDLKRMQLLSGSREERSKAIEKYGWDVQGAMYTEGVKAVFPGSDCDFMWVFVEEKYPYDVTWFLADEDTLRIGAHKLAQYRQLWASCVVCDYWPGRCVGMQDRCGLPGKSINQYRKRYSEAFA